MRVSVSGLGAMTVCQENAGNMYWNLGAALFREYVLKSWSCLIQGIRIEILELPYSRNTYWNLGAALFKEYVLKSWSCLIQGICIEILELPYSGNMYWNLGAALFKVSQSCKVLMLNSEHWTVSVPCKGWLACRRTHKWPIHPANKPEMTFTQIWPL